MLRQLLLSSALAFPALGSAAEHCTLNYPAVFEASERTSFTPETDAKVKKIHKKMGDSFTEGELLIEFDRVIPQAVFEKAQAQEEKTEAFYASKQTLFDKKVISRSELLEAKAAYIQAKADLAIARDRLEKTQLRAPYGGRVVGVSIHEEEHPSHDYYVKNKPMMEIVNDSELIAKLLVPVIALHGVHVGQTVEITVRETKATVSGIVERIGVVMDPTSSTVPVHVRLDNSKQALMGGMTGHATLLMSPDVEELL